MRAMYRRKTEKEIRCPLEYGLELFGGKWKSRIICVLAQKKTLRYGELRAELANITDAVLSAALKELLDGGMALRRSYDEIPPRVEYSLTDKGRSAVPIFRASAAGRRSITTEAAGCAAAVPKFRSGAPDR